MKKGRILIAEDNQDVALTLREGLESLDYEVCDVVPFGEELLAAVHHYQPDLMVVDIYLAGEMDGIDATAPLVAHDSPPIIFLSGNFTLELMSRLGEHQNSMLLYKPCEIPELVANIEMALERRKFGQTAFSSLFSTSHNLQTDDFRKQLGQLIKAARKEFQLTQAHAAERLNINYRYFQDIEAGKANLKIDTLFKILKGLRLMD